MIKSTTVSVSLVSTIKDVFDIDIQNYLDLVQYSWALASFE